MLSETEQINKLTENIDMASTEEILKMIGEEDKKAVEATIKADSMTARAVDVIVENFQKGGRLLYFGAGTAGRLGVLDASECPPTFSVDENLVIGTIAGGDYALRHAIEGAEDSETNAIEDFENLNVSVHDTVCAISASGGANYIVKILESGQKQGCKTILITSNKNARASQFADIVICTETGPEVITGSTRMKAGTAQKLILNKLTTASMIKCGKVYKNFMTDVKPTNDKLKKRAVSIVSKIAKCNDKQSLSVLNENGFKIKEAILKIKYSLPFDESEKLLEKNNGILRKAFLELD